MLWRSSREETTIGQNDPSTSLLTKIMPGKSTAAVMRLPLSECICRYRFEDMPPQWAAWLRYTRLHAPTLQVRELPCGFCIDAQEPARSFKLTLFGNNACSRMSNDSKADMRKSGRA